MSLRHDIYLRWTLNSVYTYNLINCNGEIKEYSQIIITEFIDHCHSHWIEWISILEFHIRVISVKPLGVDIY